MDTEHQEFSWQIQMKSTQIDYTGFQLRYGFSRSEIDRLILIIRHDSPGTPINNQAIEGVVLHLQEMGGDESSGVFDQGKQPSPWRPENAPWWNEASSAKQRSLISLYFVEWLHAEYPLKGSRSPGNRLGSQIEAMLAVSVSTLEELLHQLKTEGTAPEGKILLALAHVIGSWISLIQLCYGNPDDLKLVFTRLSELPAPVNVLIGQLTIYYDRLAALEPPIRDNEQLLIELIENYH